MKKEEMKKGKAQKLYRNEKAVSPVIGVVLMVAITVILAAIIATSVFNFASAPVGTPDLYFSWARPDASDNLVYLTVSGGSASVPLSELHANIEVKGVFTTGATIDIEAGKEATNPTVDAGDVMSVVATCDVNDEVRVILVHTPTGTVLFNSYMTAMD